jgi:hypothetical protein
LHKYATSLKFVFSVTFPLFFPPKALFRFSQIKKPSDDGEKTVFFDQQLIPIVKFKLQALN